jgi:hypothetical protein
MRKLEAELAQQALEEQQAAAKQVFVTNKGADAGETTGDPPSQAVHDGDAGNEQGNPPPAADPATENFLRSTADPGLCYPPSPRTSTLKTSRPHWIRSSTEL